MSALLDSLTYFRLLLGGKIISIDGGHGSQIIKYAIFAKYKEICGRISLHNSYFYPSMTSSTKLIQRPWILNKYGIELTPKHSIRGYTKISDERFVRVFEDSIRKAFSDIDWLNSLFPLPKDIEVEIEDKLGLSADILSDCVGLHIRQGDFAWTASTYLTDNDYAKVMAKILDTLRFSEHKIIVIFSDSLVNEQIFPELFSIIAGFNLRILVLDQADPWLSHCAMRLVNLLICSNSTFSFSAAILRSGMSIFPKEFYSDKSKPLNQIFLESANYLVRI